MKRAALVALVAAVLTVVVLVAWRGFFVQHAVIIGVAVVALVYSILRTGERLKSLYRDRD